MNEIMSEGVFEEFNPKTEGTRIAIEHFWSEDLEIDDEEDIFVDFFDEHAGYFASFAERVYEVACKRGFCGSEGDTEELVEFIQNRIEKTCAGMEKKELLSKATLKNWINKSRPSGRSRDNVYQFCFAMQMSIAEVKDFFRRGYFERAFNFKRLEDCVYAFCFQNGLSFAHAFGLIKSIEERFKLADGDEEVKQVDQENIQTQFLCESFMKAQSEEHFIECMLKYRKSFLNNNACNSNTSKECVENLLNQCKENASELRKMGIRIVRTMKNAYDMVRVFDEEDDDDKPWIINSNEQLLAEIYGFYARAHERGEQEYRDFEFTFPEYVSRNFPQNQQLRNIKHNKASNDVVRKAIVLLSFYNIYSAALLHGEDVNVADFEYETNEKLDMCGFEVLYLRNPYDYIFYYCALAPGAEKASVSSSEHTLNLFQEIVSKYWSKKN